MATRTKMAISTIAVAAGFAILQAVMGLIWESERIGNYGIVFASLFIGGWYLLLFFLYTRRRIWIGMLIILGIAIGLVVVVMVVGEPTSSNDTVGLLPYIIRGVYFIVIANVADHFAKPIHNQKVADYYSKH